MPATLTSRLHSCSTHVDVAIAACRMHQSTYSELAAEAAECGRPGRAEQYSRIATHFKYCADKLRAAVDELKENCLSF